MGTQKSRPGQFDSKKVHKEMHVDVNLYLYCKINFCKAVTFDTPAIHWKNETLRYYVKNRSNYISVSFVANNVKLFMLTGIVFFGCSNIRTETYN